MHCSRIALFGCAIAVASLALAEQAQAIVVNAALGGKPATQSSTASGGVPGRGVDGNTNGHYPSGSVTHTDASSNTPSWQVDLGASMQVEQVKIFNRTDCCAGRLSDIIIDLLAADGVTVVNTSPEFNDNNGGNTNQHVGPAMLDYGLAEPTLARYVRVSRNSSSIFGNNTDNILSLAEVQVFADNLALGKPATQSSDHGSGSFPASLAVDGNLGNFTHTESNTPNGSLSVDLEADFAIDSVIIHNRDNCCGGRLRDLIVEVLDGNGNTIATTGLLNPDNVLGAGDANYSSGPAFIGVDFHSIFGGSVVGSGIRVSRIPDGSNPDNMILSIGELQVFGQTVPEPVTGLLMLGGLGALAARRRRQVQ